MCVDLVKGSDITSVRGGSKVVSNSGDSGNSEEGGEQRGAGERRSSFIEKDLEYFERIAHH
jgi:hypothetical protein